MSSGKTPEEAWPLEPAQADELERRGYAVVKVAENERLRAALTVLLAWDQLTPCCPEGAPFHNGHNPDIRWARRTIEDALRGEQVTDIKWPEGAGG